ncbi:peptidase U32 family protein [Clostridium lacusfryxellense]|uniref:peptidase U32 family protein n=1 Tax=Clostridium lacusfryxellense TaxID=205328 RepID=UPI001C0AE13E|nr:U32 family peptidase [Clostridium lacusfryxellense]MBU3111415.1 U32 family peptidase [Clostridium lacusfryxellense]
MTRFFNENEIELLAPVGTFEIFKKVIHSGADAVYLGGKKLNMRMLRKDYNFSNDEIEEAISIAHSLNKKVYVTVNNLLNKEDLEDAQEYLRFLNRVQPDALIIQDFSILELIKSLNLNLSIHSSVMMNVHNLETIIALKECGVTRVVTSRDIDLATIKNIHKQTDMQLEYFTHGDMCIAHGAQCLYSGIIFGKSSNRGLCMKPCRWNFTMKKDGLVYPSKYPMAVKDMYMYEHLPEMIEAGIMSFKIEGRMRDSDYLVTMINYYSDAINRYIDDPICYDRRKDAKSIFETRIRDLSTSRAFGKPGLSNINTRSEGTGKIFSKPIDEIEITKEKIEEIKGILRVKSCKAQKPKLSVKVNSYSQAKVSLEEGVDSIYLSGEVYAPDIPFSKSEILKLTNNKKDTKIYLCFPRMMLEEDFSKYSHMLSENNLGLDGLVVTNLGAIHKYKSLPLELIGDYSLNIYNHIAASFFKKQGLSVATLSLETPLIDAIDVISKTTIPIEIIVHGSPTVMYMDHDLYENTKILKPTFHENNSIVDNTVLVLVDEKGNEHPIMRDSYSRNHMMLYKELCYLPFLKELNDIGVNNFRIEACNYDVHELQKILSTYRKAIIDLSKCVELYQDLKPVFGGFTLGAFQFNETHKNK